MTTSNRGKRWWSRSRGKRWWPPRGQRCTWCQVQAATGRGKPQQVAVIQGLDRWYNCWSFQHPDRQSLIRSSPDIVWEELKAVCFLDGFNVRREASRPSLLQESAGEQTLTGRQTKTKYRSPQYIIPTSLFSPLNF